MAQDGLYFDWGLKGNLEEQIKNAAKSAEHLSEVFKKLQIDSEKVTGEQIQKNLQKNIVDAEKALYKLYEAKEKVDRALSRNATMRADGFLGIDEAKLTQASARLDDIINKVMNVGAYALYSKNAVKDMLATLSSDIAIKDAKSATSAMDKELNGQIRERAKATKELAREEARAQKEAEEATARNVANQERIKNALSKIATARANLSAASEKGSQQEAAHAQLLMSLLDRLSSRLNTLKGQFLGEKGALDGILGSGYNGLMRNVSQAVRDVGKVESSIANTPINLLNGKEAQLDRIRQLTAEMTQLQDRIRSLKSEESQGVFRIGDVQTLKQRYESLRAELEAIIADMRRLGEMSNIYGGLGNIRGYTGPKSALSDSAWESAKREAEAREVAMQAEERHKQKLQELQTAFERQSRAEEKAAMETAKAAQASERSAQKQQAQYLARQKATQATRKQAEELVKLRMELLKTQQTELLGVLKGGKGVLDAQQYREVQDALRGVRQELRQLEGVAKSMGSYSIRDLFNYGRGAQNWSPLISHTQNSIDASKATQLLSESERRFVQSLTEANSALSSQGVLLSDIKTMAAQYLSLWGARSFLNNIIETGGLLEQQRLSIGAILGSIDKAEVIFSQIKDMAVKSPFGVVELDKMTKQLTAYGFQYEELFDWTKRLADISAATGTEVSRLALALGHVRAEGALSGYTLRQFAMGNIPLLQKLSENLGITTKEVREKTKKKEISYEDVKEVLKQLTDEGGMFYNAQEVMSEALNAKFKNLRDAFDIMYGEIAESGVGDLLKGIAEALTAGAKEWKRFGTDILVVAAAFGVVKMSVAAYTAGVSVLSKEMGVLSLNTMAYTALQVKQLVTEGNLTREQLLRAVATGRLSVSQAGLAAATLGVSNATLQQAASTGIVTKAMLGNAMATSRFTVAQLRLMATLKAQGALYPVLRVGLMGIGNAMRTVGAMARSFLPLLAIGAIVDFFSRYSQQVDAAKDLAKDASSAMFAGMEDASKLYDSLKKKGPDSTEAMKKSVSDIRDALKEIGAYSAIREQVEGTKELSEQYSILLGRLKEVSLQYNSMKGNAEAYLAAANNVGGGYFSDNMAKDLKQLGEGFIVKKVAEKSASKFADIYRKELVAELKKSGKWIESEMKDMDWTQLLFKTDTPFGFSVNLQRTSTLFDSDETSNIKARYNESAEALDKYVRALIEYEEHLREVKSQLPEYTELVKEAAVPFGGDVSKIGEWDDDQLRVFITNISNALKSYNLPSEIYQDILDEIISTLPEEVQVKIRAILQKDDVENQLEPWQEELQAYFDSHGIKVRVTADDHSIKSVEKKLIDSRKKAQEKMNSAGAILTYWKIKPDLSAVQEFAKKHPALAAFVNAAFKEFSEGKEEVEKLDKAHEETGLQVQDNKKTGKKSDEQLKKWKEQLKELQEFWREYEKLTKRMSDSEAVKTIQERGIFPSLVDKQGNLLFDVRKGLSAALDKLLSTTNASTTERRSFQIDVKKVRFNVDDKAAEEAVSDMLKKLERELSEQSRQWDIYKMLLPVVGGQSAMRMAFGGETGFSSYANSLRSQLKDALERGGIMAEVDDVIGMDESEIRKLGIKEQSEAYIILKKLKSEDQRFLEEQARLWTEAYKNAHEFDVELEGINNKYQELIDAAEGMRNEADLTSPGMTDKIIEGINKKKQQEIADLTWKNFKETNNWGEIFADLDRITDSALDSIIAKLKEKLPTISASTEATKALYEALEKLENAKIGRNPFAGLVKSIKKIYSNDPKERRIGQNEFNKSLKGVSEKYKDLQDVMKPVIDLFESLGKSGISDFLNIGNDMFSSAIGVSEGFKSIGGMFKKDSPLGKAFVAASPYAAAAAAGISMVSSLFALHDKALQEEIEASQARQKEMENLTKTLERTIERTLGGIYKAELSGSTKALLNGRADYYRNQARLDDFFEMDPSSNLAAAKEIEDMLSSNNIYEIERYALEEQKKELERQLAAEQDKKKSDSDAITEYRSQIAEIEDSIRDFALDMAKSLWDIDIKSWASELTDAIVSAWQNGEDAVDAYKEKVQEMMLDLTKNILAQRVLETTLDNLGLDTLIANIMDTESGRLNYDNIGQIAELLQAGGQQSADVITAILDSMESKGYISKGSGSGTSSKVIQGGFTENETGLLMSYVNAIRGDLSIQRSDVWGIRVAVEQMAGRQNVIAEAQTQQMRQIAANTLRNADAADAIYRLLSLATKDKAYGFNIQ